MRIKAVTLRLMQRWKIANIFDFIAILLVFSLAGASILYVANPILSLIGINSQTPLPLKIAMRILVIVPVYQVLVLIYGFLFGQFTFFWRKDKALVAWITERIKRKIN